MKKIPLFLACAVLVCVNWVSTATDEIAALRQRADQDGATLTDADRAVMERFWRISLDAMLLSEEPTQIVDNRRRLARERGTPGSPYALEYVQIGSDHLAAAFEAAGGWDDSQRKALMRRNLMILTARLQHPSVVALGLERIGDADDVVRYWAAKTAAGTELARQLAENPEQARLLERILGALAERVEEESKLEILQIVVDFVARFRDDAARNILMDIAGRRIQAYMGWDVQNEQFDAVLLKTMGQIVLAERTGQGRTEMARRFAELYALIFQRYLYDPSPLSDTQKSALLTVIAEVDNQILSRMMGSQTGILRAIQRRSGLDREYDTYFGSEIRAGELASQLGFNFGTGADGRPRMSPLRLPDPPQQ